MIKIIPELLSAIKIFASVNLKKLLSFFSVIKINSFVLSIEVKNAFN